jgi:hypothetical protein
MATAARLFRRAAVVVFWLLAAGATKVSAQGLQTSGNPAALHITTAVAGFNPTAKTNSATTLRIQGSSGTWHVAAKLNSNMPAGTTLTVNLAAPAGGSVSLGNVNLTNTNQTLVTNIGNIGNTFCVLTYTFNATPAAGVIASTTRTVTFSILSGP